MHKFFWAFILIWLVEEFYVRTYICKDISFKNSKPKQYERPGDDSRLTFFAHENMQIGQNNHSGAVGFADDKTLKVNAYG